MAGIVQQLKIYENMKILDLYQYRTQDPDQQVWLKINK